MIFPLTGESKGSSYHNPTLTEHSVNTLVHLLLPAVVRKALTPDYPVIAVANATVRINS